MQPPKLQTCLQTDQRSLSSVVATASQRAPPEPGPRERGAAHPLCLHQMDSLPADVELLGTVLRSPGAVPSQHVIDAFYRLGARVHAEAPGGEAAAAVAKVAPLRTAPP